MSISRHQYSRLVILTGAGISAGSSLRTYRGPDGVWEEHNVERLGHASALQERPQDTWTLFGGVRSAVLAAKPNAADLALATMGSCAGAPPNLPAGDTKRGRLAPTSRQQKRGRVARQPAAQPL
jgi:NAD-dependent deacetylase